MKTCPACKASFADDELFCGNCGTRLPDTGVIVPPEPIVPTPVIQKKPKRLTGGMILLLLLLAAAVGTAVCFYIQMDYYQDQARYYSNRYDSEIRARRETETSLGEANKELKEVQDALEAAQAELKTARQKSESSQKQITERAEKAESDLKTLLNNLKNSYGFGSRDYFAERGVIVLSKSESKSVGIICGLNTTVYYHVSDNGVSCKWGDFNDNRCLITIKAVSTGYHTVKFTNDANNASFEILVIVTD